MLASAISLYKGRRIYVTGGNDNEVAIWDITDGDQGQEIGLRTNNGEWHVLLAQQDGVG